MARACLCVLTGSLWIGALLYVCHQGISIDAIRHVDDNPLAATFNSEANLIIAQLIESIKGYKLEIFVLYDSCFFFLQLSDQYYIVIQLYTKFM